MLLNNNNYYYYYYSVQNNNYPTNTRYNILKRINNILQDILNVMSYKFTYVKYKNGI